MILKESKPGVIVGVSTALISTVSAEIIRNSGSIVHPITCNSIFIYL